MKQKVNLLHILDFLIVLLTILDTHSIYNVTVNTDYHLLAFLIVFLIIRILLSYDGISKKAVLIIPLWLLYTGIFYMISAFNNLVFVEKFIVLPILFVLYFDHLLRKGEIARLLGLYISIVKWIMGISLFFWLFGSILGILHPTNMTTIQWGRLQNVNSYFGIFFQWQNDAFFLGKQFFRNIGIFTEAPMYSLHISIAYLFEFYILRKKSIKSVIFYGVTVLSSYSVTGILLIAISQLMSISFATLSDSLKNRRLNIFLLLLPIIIILGVALGYDLLSSKLGSGSGGSRMEDYIIGYRAWKVHPWFGSGYGDISLINSLKSMVRYSRSATGYTNSPMYILTEGGIYFLLSFSFGLLHYVMKSFITKNSQLFIFSSMIIYLFLTTTFQHTALLIAIISFAFIDKLGKFSAIGSEKIDSSLNHLKNLSQN